MRRLIWIVVLAFAATRAPAEVIGVRSGDHPNFARLVLSIPEGADWALSSDGPPVLRIEGATEYGLDTVFDRIARDRILGLASDGADGLRISLACACEVDAFLWRRDRLVVDVIDPDPATVVEGPDTDDPSPPSAVAGLSRPGLLPIVFGLPAGSEEAAALPAEEEAPQTSGLQGGIEERLLVDLADAAGRAAIDFVGALPSDSDAAGPDTVEATPDSLVSSLPGLLARTSAIEMPQAAQLSGQCGPASRFELPAWQSEGEDFSTGLGRRRAALATEAGDFDAVAVLDLARFYLSYGFGREALELLRTLPDGSDVAAAVTIAMAIEDRGKAGPALVASGCDGPIVLWSALSINDVSGLSEADRRKALTAFRSLPEALRAFLGPRLSRLLAEAGDIGAADAVLSETLQTGLADPSEARRTEIDVALATRDMDHAATLMSDAVNTAALLTPEVLTGTIEMEVATGRPVDARLLSLADAMRFEQRGTSAEAALLVAEIRARIAAGDLGTASALIDGATALDDPVRGELLSALTTSVAQQGDEMGFLDFAFSPIRDGTPEMAINLLAERLLDLGFVDRAETLLLRPATGAALLARQELRARASSMAGREEAGLTGAVVAETMPNASALSEPVGETASDALVPRLPPVPDSGPDDLITRLTELRQDLRSPDAPGETLAARRDVLARSGEARSLIEEVLQGVPAVEPVPGN